MKALDARMSLVKTLNLETLTENQITIQSGHPMYSFESPGEEVKGIGDDQIIEKGQDALGSNVIEQNENRNSIVCYNSQFTLNEVNILASSKSFDSLQSIEQIDNDKLQ